MFFDLKNVKIDKKKIVKQMSICLRMTSSDHGGHSDLGEAGPEREPILMLFCRLCRMTRDFS